MFASSNWFTFLVVCLASVVVCAAAAGAGQQDAPPPLIEPREYVRIHRLACQTNRTLMAIAERVNEQTRIERYKKQEKGCVREPQAWRWKYFDENDGPKARVLLRERTLDERLANIIYTTTSTKMFDIDGFRFNSGDPEMDRQNIERVAGDQVNDQLCQHQLGQMLSQIYELAQLNIHLRQATSETKGGQKSQLTIDERSIRLARVLDSFGRYESNHLSGRFISMGSYEQCRSSQLLLANSNEPSAPASLVSTRFCWARHKLDAALDESLRARRKTSFEPEANVLLSGVCVPESCHTRSFANNSHLFRSIIGNQFRLPNSMYVNETLELESVFCLVDETSAFAQIPLAGKVLLVSVLAYLLLAAFVTWRNVRARKLRNRLEAAAAATATNGTTIQQAPSAGDDDGRDQDDRQPTPTDERALSGVLDTLDLVQSWRDFVESDREHVWRPIELNTINPIKVLGCAYVVFGHSIVLMGGFMMDEISTIQSYERNSLVLIALGGTTVVDTFFVMSGMLMTFFALKKLNKLDLASDNTKFRDIKESSAKFGLQLEVHYSDKATPGKFAKVRDLMQKWLFLSLVRYLRLVPMFCLVYALKRWVMLYTGSGPMWDHGLNKDTPVGACKNEAWYMPLTPVSAFLPLTKQCLLQSWSISNDLFFSLILPPIILLLHSRPNWAIALSSVLSLLSACWNQWSLAQVRPDLHFELHDARGYSFTRIVNEYSFLYTQPNYRMFSILTGLLAGYALFQYNQKRSKQSQHIKTVSIFAHWLKGPATWLSYAVIVGMSLMMIYSQDIKQLVAPYHSYVLLPLWLTGTRLPWTLANAFLLLRMITDWRHTPLMRLYASKFWKISSKLIFTILLIHFDLLAFMHASSARTVNNSLMNAFTEAAGVYLYCLPLSIFLFVVFENPINKLINITLFKRIKQV